METNKGKLALKLQNKEKKFQTFELMGVDGKTYRLSDYKGKKVYIKFWASWCSVCLASLPDTDELAKEAGDDFVILDSCPIAKESKQKKPSKNGIRAWTIKISLSFRPFGKTLASYGVRSYPTQAFIDKEGKTSQDSTILLWIRQVL